MLLYSNYYVLYIYISNLSWVQDALVAHPRWSQTNVETLEKLAGLGLR